MENGFAAPFTARSSTFAPGRCASGRTSRREFQLLNALRGEKALRTYPVLVEEGNVVVDV